jgi:hypothetical protein
MNHAEDGRRQASCYGRSVAALGQQFDELDATTVVKWAQVCRPMSLCATPCATTSVSAAGAQRVRRVAGGPGIVQERAHWCPASAACSGCLLGLRAGASVALSRRLAISTLLAVTMLAPRAAAAAGKWRNDEVEGTLQVDNDLEFAGLVTGTIRVTAGATLVLEGMAGDLIVGPGATAIVLGTVTGAATNHGGHLEIHGTIGSTSDTAPAAVTRIMPQSTVNGVRQ